MEPRRKVCWLVILPGFFLAGPPGPYAGRLKQIEEEVSRPRRERDKKGYQPFYSQSGDLSSGDFFPSDSSAYFVFGTPAAASEYRTLLDSYSGVVGLNPGWSIYSAFSYLYDVGGDLDGFGLAARARTPVGTVHADFTRFRERVAGGNDYLNLYYLSYSISSYIEDRAIIDIGLGYAGLWGEKSYDGGGIHVAGEFLLFDPLLLDISLRYSKIHGTAFGDYRAGMLLNLGGAAFRVGYRYIQIESAPDIRGPEASFGIRF